MIMNYSLKKHKHYVFYFDPIKEERHLVGDGELVVAGGDWRGLGGLTEIAYALVGGGLKSKLPVYKNNMTTFIFKLPYTRQHKQLLNFNRPLGF